MKITIVNKKDRAKEKKLYKNFSVGSDGEVHVAIGGDGTFIKAAEATERPVLLIRDEEQGSIGYHSDVSVKDMDFIIRKLKSNDFYVEHIANKIEVKYKGRRHLAVNEARLNNIMAEVSFNVYERNNGKRTRIYPFVMSGDGLLVTGKIGSTAYNKSAGGPIILAHNVMCITFLNPDGPYGNPIIVDSTKEIEIEVVKYEGLLAYDFRKIGIVKPGDSFTVKMSDKKINVVRFRGRSEGIAQKLERKIKSRMVKDFKD